MKRSSLSIHVQGINLLNSLTKQIVGSLVPTLQPFINVKLYKTDGEKTKKFDISLPKIARYHDEPTKTFVDYSYYLTAKYGELQMKIKLCINGGSYDTTPKTAFTRYFDKTITLGTIEENVLISIKSFTDHLNDPYNHFDTTYTEAEIQAKFDAYTMLKAKLELVQREIPSQFSDIIPSY